MDFLCYLKDKLNIFYSFAIQTFGLADQSSLKELMNPRELFLFIVVGRLARFVDRCVNWCGVRGFAVRTILTSQTSVTTVYTVVSFIRRFWIGLNKGTVRLIRTIVLIWRVFVTQAAMSFRVYSVVFEFELLFEPFKFSELFHFGF